MKNFNLLRIVEKIETRKTINSYNSLATRRDDLEIKEKKKFIREELKHMETCERLSKESVCKKHSLPVHFYAIGTNLLFCDKCENETDLKTFPMPNVNFNLLIEHVGN
jgi:hypothetical protein